MAVVNCNNEFCAHMGYFKDELIGSNIGNLMPQKNATFFHDLMNNAEDETEERSLSFVFKRKNGLIRVYPVDYRLKEDKSGNVFLIVVLHCQKAIKPSADILIDS